MTHPRIGYFYTVFDLAIDYLKGRGGSWTEFQINFDHGQRLGQAFFNALSGEDQERIRPTTHDPFYTSGPTALEKSIEFLLNTEGK